MGLSRIILNDRIGRRTGLICYTATVMVQGDTWKENAKLRLGTEEGKIAIRAAESLPYIVLKLEKTKHV